MTKEQILNFGDTQTIKIQPTESKVTITLIDTSSKRKSETDLEMSHSDFDEFINELQIIARNLKAANKTVRNQEENVTSRQVEAEQS